MCRLSIARPPPSPPPTPRPALHRTTPHRTVPRAGRSVARARTLHVPASDGRPRDPVCIEWDKVHLIETNLHRQSTGKTKKKKKKRKLRPCRRRRLWWRQQQPRLRAVFVISRLIYAPTAGFDIAPFVTTSPPV